MSLQQRSQHPGIAARAAMTVLMLLAVAACATPPEDPAARIAYDEANDPFEPTNRYIYNVNTAIDDVALMPMATIYREGVPDLLREGIRNFLVNLRMPVTILNSALQGDWENTGHSTATFLINSTAGLGGIFDIPGSFDDDPRREDFGQTLGVWGAGEGAFIELPLIGPSSVRDTVGLGVDILTDPLTYLLSPAWTYARMTAEAVRIRAELGEDYDTMRNTSIDFYATVRSLYRQDRAAKIANGDGDMPLFDDE
jgi:phospholipid-binding lipoprotein MlaA